MKYKPRITGRVEEWWKDVCQRHKCKYYIHQDYPSCSYCTCPDNCIVTGGMTPDEICELVKDDIIEEVNRVARLTSVESLKRNIGDEE